MKISTILLISTILGLCCAGDLHRVAGARWNNPQQSKNTHLGLYFTLDTALPLGGNLVLTSGTSALNTWTTTCNVYPVTTTLDPAKFDSKTAGRVEGTLTTGTCVLKAALNANTAYAMVVVGTEAVAGVYGPIGMTTYAYGATGGVMLDQNNELDMYSVLAAPTDGMVLAVSQDKTDTVNAALKTELGKALNFNFELTFPDTLKPSTDATAPFYVNAPFNVVLEMVQPTMDSKLTTSQWSWNTAGTCNNYQFGQNAAEKVDNKIVPELALGNLACTDAKGVLTIPVPKNDLSTKVAWSKFLLNFRLSLKMPTTYVGSAAPTFKSSLMKDGQVVLNAATAAACANCAVTHSTGTSGTGNSVQLSWGLVQSSKDGVAAYAAPYCLLVADVAKDTGYTDLKVASNCAPTGEPTDNIKQGTTPMNSAQFQWKMHAAIPDDSTNVEFACKMSNNANTAYLLVNQATAQFHGWGKANCWYAGVTVTTGVQNFKCVDTGKLDKDTVGYLSFQFQLLAGPKTWASDANVVGTPYSKMTCTATVKAQTDTWYTVATELLKIDNGDAVKYETFVAKTGESSVPLVTSNAVSPATGTAVTADFVFTWQAFPKADARWTADTAGGRLVPVEATATVGKDLQVNVYGATTFLAATHTMTTALVGGGDKNPYNTDVAKNTWLAAMDKNTAKSTGGYVSYTAGQRYGGTCTADSAVCTAGDDLANYFMAHGAVTKEVAYNSFTWTTGALYTNPKFMTTFRGRGEFASGSFSTTNQALNDYFWTVSLNGTTEWSTGWMVSTLSHVYLTATPLSLYATYATQDMGTGKVAVSFPIWSYGGTVTNDGTVAPNLVKITVAAANPNQFVGFFVPTGQPFMHSDGGNRVQVVGKDASCWMYGQANGNGYLQNLAKTDCGAVAGVPQCLSSPVFTLSAPYLVYTTMNFLACDVSTAQTAHDVYVPMRNNDYAKTWDTDATLLLKALARDKYTAKAGAASLVLASVQLWDGSQPKATASVALDTSSAVGYYVLFGASRYLNKMTGYAQGFQKTASESLQLAFQGGAADGSVSGPVTATAVTASASDYDIVADPDTTKAGTAGVYKLVIKAGSVAANNMAVMVVCGKEGLMSGVGDVSTANPATNDNKCQSLSWNADVSGVAAQAKPRMCMLCPMAASTASQALWMSTLNPPLYAGRLVEGFYVATSTVGAFFHVPEATKTVTLLKVDVVSACSGPATVNMGVKGQTATFSVTTKNAVATGVDLVWVGVKDTPIDMQAAVGADSGVISCGTYTQTVTPVVAGKALRAQLTDATNTNGAAACGAGVIQLVVREWSSTNAATADQKKKTNCMVCIDASTCDAISTTAHLELDTNAYAIGKDTVEWEFNQSGATKQTTLTADNMVHSVDVKGAMGSWAFTPSVGALGLWKDQTTVTYTFGDASFTGSVCQIVGSSAISKCEPSGSNVKLTWGADASSVDFTVRMLNVPAWKPTSLKVQASSTMYATSVLANPLLTAQQSFTAPAAAPATLTTVALVSQYSNSGDLGTLRFDLTMGLLTSWKKDDTMTVNMPTYYQPRLGGQAACWLWVQEEDPADKTKLVTVQKEQLYCEHVLDWTLKVWGPQNNEQVKSTKTGATFKFSVQVTGVQMHKTTAGKFQVLSEGWVNVKTTTKDADGKDVEKNTMTATTEYGTVTDAATNEWSQSTVDLQSVVATGTSARATTSLTVRFVTSSSAKMDTSNFVGLELPYQWGNVLRGASGSATVTTVGAVKLSEWSVVNKLPKETDVEVKLDAGSVSGRSFKVCTVDKVSADGKTKTAVVLKKSTNYTLTVASLATPAGATTWGQVRVTVGDKATGGHGTSNAQMATQVVAHTQFGYGTLSALGFAAGMTTVNRGTYSGQVCVQAASGNLGTGVSVAVVGKLFVMVPATLVGVQGQAQVCGLLGTAATTQGSKFQVGFTLTQTETVYTKLPSLTVSVSEATVQVKTASSVNCVAAGSSDPVVFSTAAAPSGTLTLELVKKVKAKGDTVEPSLGVTTVGSKYAFGVGKLGGFFYLTCDAKLPASPASKLSYKLDGTAKASYTLQNADLTVNMVKPATRDAKAVMAVTVAASGNTASHTSVTVLCPASGTAYVQWVPLDQSAASKRWATAADAAAEWAVWSGRAVDVNEWQKPQMARAAVTAAATATALGPFQSASKRQYHAWAYCLDASNNWYAQEKASNVTAVDNGGAVLDLAYTFDTADVNACKDNAMVLDVCCTVASGLGRPQNAVVDMYGGHCGNPSPTKPAECPKPAPVANKTNATNATNATKPAAKARLLAEAKAAPKAAVVSSKVTLSVQPDPRATKATSSADLTTAVGALHGKVKAMLTAKNYKVTLGVAPTVTVAAAEAAVAWKVKPSAVADFKFVTLSGTTSAAGNVYCFVSKAGTAKPKATTTRILADAKNATANATAPAAAPAAVDPWAWEKANMMNLGSKYNAQRVLTKATAFTFTMKFDGLTEDRVYKWVCQATSVNPSMSAALYRTESVMDNVTTKLTPPKSSSDSVIMTSVFSAIVMLITAFLY